MVYKVTVYDYDTGAPVQGAAVSFLDYDGNTQDPILVLTTGPDGSVSVDGTQYPVIADSGGYNVTRNGYDDAGRFPGVPLAATETIEIRKKPFKVPYLLLGAGVVGVYAAATSRPKKKVSGAADYVPYVVPVALVTGVGILVYKVGQKFGLFDDEAQKRQKAEAQAREADQQASMDQICQVNPTTKTQAEWVEIADKIEAGLDYAGYLQSYADDVVYNLCRAKNDCDVQQIIYYFGHRALRSPILIKSGDYTLAKGVLERLSQSDVDTINNNYAEKGISFRW